MPLRKRKDPDRAKKSGNTCGILFKSDCHPMGKKQDFIYFNIFSSMWEYEGVRDKQKRSTKFGFLLYFRRIPLVLHSYFLVLLCQRKYEESTRGVRAKYALLKSRFPPCCYLMYSSFFLLIINLMIKIHRFKDYTVQHAIADIQLTSGA